jgi:hypothetical protein
VVVHHLVLQRGTTAWSSNNLPLLGFLVCAHCVVRDHDVADEVWECPSSVECHALLQLGGETDHEAVLLLVVSVYLVRCILRQVVELLGVVVHGPSSLLEVHELLALLPHLVDGDVVGTEGIVKFNPRYLIVRGVSGGVVGPPRSCCVVKRVFCTSVQHKSPNLDTIT